MSDLHPLHRRDFHILLGLLEAPLHGYGLVKAIERRTDGELTLDPANLYRALQRLEEAELVAETEPPDDDVVLDTLDARLSLQAVYHTTGR